MIPIIHKVNDTNKLLRVPTGYGIEIDIRYSNNKLVLAHEVDSGFTELEEVLSQCQNRLIVANIKESGIENLVFEIFKSYKIENFFLLDIEFPYLLNNFRDVGKYLSLRFSKLESISAADRFINKVGWLWIDTYENFKLSSSNIEKIKNFKTCLVSPSRWGKKDELEYYIQKFLDEGIHIDAVMIEESEKIIF
jgi:hypothetical protein